MSLQPLLHQSTVTRPPLWERVLYSVTHFGTDLEELNRRCAQYARSRPITQDRTEPSNTVTKENTSVGVVT